MNMQANNDDVGQKGRLFILGAGFSAAAGIPMTSTLLEQTMLVFKAECPGIFERVQNYARVSFGLGDSEPDYRNVSFSELCTFLDYVELRESGGGERWSEHGSRERLALKHYLGKAIVSMTPESDKVPELYQAFAAQLRERDVIITFNWDCLLENALEAVGKPYTYGASDNVALISKMHGSVHWRIGNRPSLYPSRLAWQPIEFIGIHDSGLYCSDHLRRREAWHGAQPIGGEVEPFLVLPGFGKAKDVQTVRWLWYKPEGFFPWAHHVYVIGLSLSPDDFFLRSFLLTALSEWDGRITIINPDPIARSNYGFLPRGQLSYRLEKFALDHVQEMHNDLKPVGALELK